VLIDDGTPAAHENIARFVRGFRPAKVVKWTVKDAKPGGFESADMATIQSCVARAWGLPSEKANPGDLLDQWKKDGFTPPGLVVAQPGDTAWTAALALGAGRGQPIVSVKATKDLNAEMPTADADAMEQAIEGAA